MIRLSVVFALFVLVAIPQLIAAQTSTPPTLGRGGIIDCMTNYPGGVSVGVSAGSGGVVPVRDDAVITNTYQLLRKECIVLEILNSTRKLAVAQEVEKINNQIGTGRTVDVNGTQVQKALYAKNADQELLSTRDNVVYQMLRQSAYFDTLNPAFRENVKSAMARSYVNARKNPNKELECDYEGDLAALYSGRPTGSIWEALYAMQQPECNPLFAYEMAQEHLYAAAAAAEECQRRQWEWGDGYYAVLSDPSDPCSDVQTPAAIVRDSHWQAVGAGFEMQKMADDVGELVDKVFTQISSLATTPGGLAGNVTPSYLNQMVAQARQGVITSVGNAGTAALGAAIARETEYLKVWQAIAALILEKVGTRDTPGTLRIAQDKCLDLVHQAVCEPSSISDGSCKAKDGGQKLELSAHRYLFADKVAESSSAVPAFGKSIDNFSKDPVQKEVDTSAKSIEQLQKLSDRISNPISEADRNLAISQADALVRSGVLKTNAQIAEAASKKTVVETALGTLIYRLITSTDQPPAEWTNSTTVSATTGWCNVSEGNPSRADLLKKWTDCLKQGSSSCIFPREKDEELTS